MDIIYKAIVYIIQNNKSNHVPYHGIDHLYEVFNFAITIASNQQHFYNELINIEALSLACLFHDFNHAGKMIDDNINIQNAIKGFEDFITQNLDFITNSASNIDVEYVKYLIECTKFPSDLNKEDLTNEGKIIQDADMCYLFKPLSIVKLYSGLKDEFNQDLNTFLDGQFKFFDSLKFNTEYCQNLWETDYHIRVNEVKQLRDAM